MAEPSNTASEIDHQVVDSVDSVEDPTLTSPQPIINGVAEQVPVEPPNIQMPSVFPQTGNLQHLVPTTDYSLAQPISADEIALYDRQIRLWGVKAQEKLRSAKILLIGMRSLANEIAKNLVLAGVGSLTILDFAPVTEDDLGSQFFVTQDQIGQNRAEAALPQIVKLNPRVQVFADPNLVTSKLPEYFSMFDITIATNLDISSLASINAACRFSGRKFYAADTHGMYGYVFADLILHDFVVEREKGNKLTEIGTAETATRLILSATTKKENGKNIEIVSKSESYSPLILANASPLPAEISNNRRRRLQVTPLLSCLRALFDFQNRSGGRFPLHNRADLEAFTRLATEKHQELLLPPETLRSDFLRSFLQNLGSEISPVAAFLGGAVAQDVINVLGQREQPLQNFLLFDGEEFKGPIYSMHPYIDDTMPMPVPMAMNISNGVTANSDSANFSNDFINGFPAAATQMV